MRKISLIVSVLFLTVLAWYSCSKTDLTETQPNAKNLSATQGRVVLDPMTTHNVQFNNGILEFEDYQSYLSVYNELLALSNDRTYAETILHELGYDTDPESDAMVTDQPVLEKFEKRFSNFTSARSVEEQGFFNHLRNGGDTETYDEGFIYDPILKAFLNERFEIKIGDRYFKFIDKSKVVMILGDDYQKLESVRQKAPSELKDEYNIMVWNRNNLSEPDFELFDRDNNGNIAGFRGLCDIKFKVKEIDRNFITFENTSLVGVCSVLPNAKFIWDFGDGTTFTGVTPPPHYFASLPSVVKLSMINCTDCGDRNFTLVADRACNANFKAVLTQGNIVIVTAETNIPEAKFKWDFGDGGTSTSQTLEHAYDAQGTADYTIGLTVTMPDGTTCSTTQTINAVGCGARNGKENRTTDLVVNPSNGRFGRLSGNIWCQNNFFQCTMGSSSKCYKQYSGIWISKKATTVTTTIVGDFFERDCVQGQSVCTNTNVPFEVKTLSSEHRAAIDVPIKDPSFLDGHLISTHTMVLDGVSFATPTIPLID